MYNHATMLTGGVGSFWEQLVNWYQNSFFNDILSYIIERYYSVEFGAYEYFSFGAGANQTAQMLIISLAFGFIIAAIVVAHTKKKLGGFVGSLLKNECYSPESAKSLYELGYFRNATIRRELSRGVTLKRLVFQADGAAEQASEESVESADSSEIDAESPTEEKKNTRFSRFLNGRREERIDFIQARFYIPEDLKYRAELRFDRNGSGWIPVLITAIGSLVGAALICRFLPDFIRLLDNLIILTAP